MKRAWLILGLVPLALGACGEGGVSGTGLTGSGGSEGVPAAVRAAETVVQGNIAEVVGGSVARVGAIDRLLATLAPLPSAHADSPVEGIHVEVEGTDRATTTDVNGFFSLGTGVDGDLTILFRRGEDVARLSSRVPYGGVLTLQNIRLDFGSGAGDAQTEGVAFDGVVVETRCLRSSIVVASRAEPDGARFTVDTKGGTVHREDGTPVGCDSLSAGDAVSVSGVLEPDGTVSSGSASESATSPASAGSLALPTLP